MFWLDLNSVFVALGNFQSYTDVRKYLERYGYVGVFEREAIR
jgi:hypothetical protein